MSLKFAIRAIVTVQEKFNFGRMCRADENLLKIISRKARRCKHCELA
jgi:hypothetical protein